MTWREALDVDRPGRDGSVFARADTALTRLYVCRFENGSIRAAEHYTEDGYAKVRDLDIEQLDQVKVAWMPMDRKVQG